MKKRRPGGGDGAETETAKTCHAISTTPAPPSQDTAPHDFEAADYPILARHWFALDKADSSLPGPIGWWR